MAAAVASSLTLAGGLAATPASAATPPMLFGIGDHWEPDVAHDDAQLGIQSGIVGLFAKWGTTQTSPVIHWMDWVRARGGAPMIDLMPPTTATDAQIAAGAQDGYLNGWAQAMRNWGHPILLRVLPEMNGNWESYSPWTRGQSPAQYRAAFRHIVTVFRNQGASNVKMVWNPDKPFKGSVPLAKVWPGDAYVDWTSLDIYNWRDRAHGSWTAWQAVVPAVNAVRAISSKPLFFAEIGVQQFAGKGKWIANAVSIAQAHGVKAMVWFDENLGNGPKWRLDTSSSALQAAVAAVHQPYVTSAERLSQDAIDNFVTNGGF